MGTLEDVMDILGLGTQEPTSYGVLRPEEEEDYSNEISTYVAPDYVEQWSDVVDTAINENQSSLGFNLDSKFVKRIIQQESGGDQYAQSYAGAMGLMQLMPQTAEAMGVYDPFNAEENIRGGVKLLSQLMDKYDGDKKKVLAAYNGGESGVDQAVEKYGDKWLNHLDEFKGVDEYTGQNHAVQTWNYIDSIENDIPMSGISSTLDDVMEILGIEETAEEPPAPAQMAEVPVEAPPVEEKPKEKLSFREQRDIVHEEIMERGEFLNEAAERFKKFGKEIPEWADVKKMEKDDKFAYNYYQQMKSLEGGTAFLSGAAGALVPFSGGLKTGIQKKAEAEKPVAATTGKITGTVGAAMLGGTAISKAISKIPAIAKSPVLSATLSRMVTSGAISAGQQDWKDNFVESLKNVAESAGAGAVSILPEIAIPAEGKKILLQAIAQPLADVVYNAAIGKLRGRSAEETTKQTILDAALGLGFSIIDIKSGDVFRAGQIEQRAEIGNWVKNKGKKGFKIEVSEENVQETIKNLREFEAKQEVAKPPEAQPPTTTKIPVIEKEAEFDVVQKGGLEIGKAKRPQPTETELAELPPETPVKPVEEGEPTPIPEGVETWVHEREPYTPKPEEEMETTRFREEFELLRKEQEAETASYETKKQKLEIEKESVEFAKEFRKSFTEEMDVKDYTSDEWAYLTGKKTKDAEGNLITRSEATEKKLQKIADAWNLAKEEGLGATRQMVPPERVLNTVDNWTPDDVQDVLSTATTGKEYRAWKRDYQTRLDDMESQREKYYEETGKRQDEIEAKIGAKKETEFAFGDESNMFSTGRREPVLEGQAGYTKMPRGARKKLKEFKNFLIRNFASKGHFPEKVFEDKILTEGIVNAELKSMEDTAINFRKEAKKAYGKKYVSDEVAFKIDEVFKGQKSIETLPENLRPSVIKMRNDIDVLSQKLIDSGLIEGDLAVKFKENMGAYAYRSYRIHDGPKWVNKVPDEVVNRAKAFLRKEVAEDVDFIKMSDTEKESYINGMINELLYNQKTSPLEHLTTGKKFGEKTLDVLKKRKDIPAEIRALWGEYKNADVNYVKSVSKMVHLLANHNFLTKVAAEGEGKYFFKKPTDEYAVQLSTEKNPAFKPLAGLYTTKEIAQAFEDATEKVPSSDLFRWYMKVNAGAKYAKTVGSFMTHVRNTTGNAAFAIANGHFNVKSVPDAIKKTFADLSGKGSKETKAYLNKMRELGIVGTGGRSGEVKAIINDATQGDLDVMIGTGPKTALRKGLKLVEKAYGAEDDVWKIFAFENEMKRYKEALPDMPLEELEKKVAKIVRDTYPTYPMVPRAIKKLRRFPLIGTFVSFPAEVMRTAKNTIGLAVQELKDPALRKIGAQRLTGIITAASITGTIGMASKFIGKKEPINKSKEDALRDFLPPWSKNSQIVFTSDIENGKGTYVDMGYSDPHSYLKNVAIAAMRGEDWEKKAFEAGVELFAPFLSEDMLTQKLVDISRNKTKDGQPVWNPEDSFEKKSADAIMHVVDALEPGTLSGIERMYKSLKNEEGKVGTKYNLKTEAFAQTTGIRMSVIDVEKSLGYKAYTYLGDIRNARRLERKRGEDVSEKSEENIDIEFAKVLNSALILGLSKSEINKILRDNNVSGKSIRRLHKYF